MQSDEGVQQIVQDESEEQEQPAARSFRLDKDHSDLVMIDATGDR